MALRSRRRYLQVLTLAFAAWWTLLAFDVHDRADWLLENVLVFAFVAGLWLARKRFVFSRASSTLASLVYLDGIITPHTLSAPSASTATAAVSAESMPPERPRITPGKPFRPT